MRKIMAVLAAPGLIAGIYIFIASFFGLTMDKLGAKAVLLHLGIFALFVPLMVAERWGKGVKPFLGKPRWVVRSQQILFLLFVAMSCRIARNHQRGIRLKQSWKNNRVHLRTRLSLPERL